MRRDKLKPIGIDNRLEECCCKEKVAAGGSHFLREFFCFVCFVWMTVEITVSLEAVPVSCGCCSKSPQTGWLKTKEMCHALILLTGILVKLFSGSLSFFICTWGNKGFSPMALLEELSQIICLWWSSQCLAVRRASKYWHMFIITNLTPPMTRIWQNHKNKKICTIGYVANWFFSWICLMVILPSEYFPHKHVN